MRPGPGGRGRLRAELTRLEPSGEVGVLGILGPDAGSNTSGSWTCLASVWAPNPDRGGSYLQLLEGRGAGGARWGPRAIAALVPFCHWAPFPGFPRPPCLAPDGPSWVASQLLQFLFSRSFCPPPTPTACWVNSGSDWAGCIWCGLARAIAPSPPPGYSDLLLAPLDGSPSGIWCHRGR